MITEFAFKLNGISLENMLQLEETTINEAALNNYIYAYCQDDNTLALGGAVNQKHPIIFHEGAAAAIVLYRYEGAIHGESELKNVQELNDKARAEAYGRALDNGQALLPEYTPELLPQAQWRIKASFPVSEFDIFTGDHLFCRAIVFSADDVQ